MRPTVFRLIAARDAERVDRLICDETGHGRRAVRTWLREGRVRINGHVATAAQPVGAGSEIVIDPTGEAQGKVVSENDDRAASDGLVAGLNADNLHVVFESEDIVVVAKPAGVHSERGKSEPSLAGLLEQRYGDLSGIGDRAAEAGLVHRLDRDTSGVVVAARTRPVYRALRREFSRGATAKQYLALVRGRLAAQDIDLPLVQRGAHAAIAGPRDQGMDAFTSARPLETGGDWTLVLAELITGAMHQVRCHLAAIGHPLFGDPLYGGDRLADSPREGQLLHALRVRIGTGIDVTVGPPQDFLAAYAALRRRGR
ncbi:MAG TPA: RluA family pseudouridine synthase [Candidatus Limnocylindrales bacterium]|nr:RluA family pseudouridine synthase [Candidatus Limnocylindrales bacterium]